GVDKGHFEKIIKLADDISQEAHKLLEEDKEEFGKALEAGTATGNTGPSGPQAGGQALRAQSLEPEVKVTTNKENEDLIKYTMEKSLVNDEKVALKIIEYARLLKEQKQ
ncbi:MAG: hypothetical protein PHN89_05230, partial [Candidatus Pacebacteria bacterium]|nr:hypothetical protein [Candidatus Paceibacterota bacterium]